ncbi:MAG: hypothetical protein Q7S92_04935 [Candidatus Diapherotrites archaeon]|nr:hypothetical protein [Candidatus Diapherotrites archaeon]
MASRDSSEGVGIRTKRGRIIVAPVKGPSKQGVFRLAQAPKTVSRRKRTAMRHALR